MSQDLQGLLDSFLGPDEKKDFEKYRLSTTDGYISEAFQIGQDVTEEEFTKEFAQGQLKALNLLNNAYRDRLHNALEELKDGTKYQQKLNSLKLHLTCMALVAQTGMQQNIMERAKGLGYDLKVYAKFTDEELDDIEEKRIHKLHGWSDDETGE